MTSPRRDDETTTPPVNDDQIKELPPKETEDEVRGGKSDISSIPFQKQLDRSSP